MFNKILMFWGLALSAILIVENMVVPTQAFVFLSKSSTTWMLSIVSIIIWVAIWFWIRWFMNQEDSNDESLDF